ncbi:hypothetical protein E4U33_006380 [Claviceps sp. LM78 group G4]|nr:hypothetical protein E4U33_006380 [Claviceps sp. LM78 group G4]
MAPPHKSQRSLSDTVDATERHKVLAANETSRAFIGGRRPSWMSSLSTPCTPTSPGPARVQKTRRGRAAIRENRSVPVLPTAVISPQSAAATGEMDLLPNLSEPPSGTLPPSQVPTTSEDHVLWPGAKIAAVGNGQRPVKPVDSLRTAIFLDEQQNASVADPASTTAEPFTELHDELQTELLSLASSPTVVTGGPSRDDPEHDGNGSHPPRQLSDPSLVQVMVPANQGSISPRSMNPRVRGISSFASRRLSHPDKAAIPIPTKSPIKSPAQASRQTPGQTPTQTPVPAHNLYGIWLYSISQRLAEPACDRTVLNSIEKWRYDKLSDACQQGDFFYIHLHRILCRWSIKPTHPLAMSLSNPNLNDALGILQQMLRPAHELRSHHNEWFIRFPWNPYDPSKLFQFSNECDQVVYRFLNTLSQLWDQILSFVTRRRFPLLVHELIYTLECPSEILRLALFTASCRFLGLSNGGESAELASIFQVDRQNETLAACGKSGSGDLACRRQAVITHYRRAVDNLTTHQNMVQANESTSPSMLTPTSTPVAYQSSEVPPVPVDWALSTNSSGTQARYDSQLLFQQAFPTQTSIHVGSPLTPHGGSFSIPNGYRASLPSGQMPAPSAVNASPSYATQTAFGGESSWPASALPSHNTSQTRGRDLRSHGMSHGMSQTHNVPSSAASVTLPMVASSRSGTEENKGYSTIPLPQGQYPLSPYSWTSVQSGLHLVRLRSPDRTNPGGDGSRYYQFVSGFALNPTPIYPQRGVQRFDFTVTADDFSIKSGLKRTEDTVAHHFKHGSLRYRLRMIQGHKTKRVIDRDSWLASSSIWPAEIYLLFNDEPVYPRRGHHFHHDIPIELTDLLREGLNTISVSLPKGLDGSSIEEAGYHLAVERVVTMDHASTVDMVCKGQRIGPEETCREIQRRMQMAASDDVIVQDDCLCISVTDPFSASMFQIPVRGSSCKHIECFDLQTWLQTRSSKESLSRTEPSLADGWKCPICNGYAAPPNLRVDEYLVDVERALKLAGQVQTRSISAHLDGSWTANEEPGSDSDDDEVQGNKERSQQSPATRIEREVIEIMSD